MSLDVNEYQYEKSKLVFPILPIPLLTELCSISTRIVGSENIVLELKGSFIVVGDLHGHILDLFRILRAFGHPPKQKYIFLGDIVDRGEFSTETLILVLLMKVLWPESVYIIRGNHEFSEMCEISGFYAELKTLYGENPVSKLFANIFSYLPLVAIVNEKYICVHGGIGPQTPNITQIGMIRRPLSTFISEPVLSIVWSDPSNSTTKFMPSATRGLGFLYGSKALETFLQSQNLELLIRGHECVNEGIEYALDNQCVTVFSASNYCGVSGNKCGVLLLKQSGKPESTVMDPMKYLKRSSASFLESSSETSLNLTMKPVLKRSNTTFPTLNGSPLSVESRKRPSNHDMVIPSEVVRPRPFINKSASSIGVARKKSFDRKSFDLSETAPFGSSQAIPKFYSSLQPTTTKPKMANKGQQNQAQVQLANSPPAKPFATRKRKMSFSTASDLNLTQSQPQFGGETNNSGRSTSRNLGSSYDSEAFKRKDVIKTESDNMKLFLKKPIALPDSRLFKESPGTSRKLSNT